MVLSLKLETYLTVLSILSDITILLLSYHCEKVVDFEVRLQSFEGRNLSNILPLCFDTAAASL